MIKIAIIVPYYQREAGLLRRALETVYAQDVGEDVAVEVIVVNDESPSAPAPEIEGLARPHFTITLLEQPNGGPARARNRALDHASNRADYVAFLDSDDWWMPTHLSIALAALKDGAGFYFANNIPEPHTTWFEELRCGDTLIASAEPSGHGWRRIPQDILLPLFLAECVAHTSSVVIDMACIRDKRFDESQARAGEDYLFWLDAVTHAPNAALCVEPQAVRGHGVDLDRGAYSWDSPECIRRSYYNLMVRKKARKLYCRTDEQRRMMAKLIGKRRREISYLFMRNAFTHRKTNSWVLANLVRHDPAFFPLLPYNVAITTWQRLRNRLDLVER